MRNGKKESTISQKMKVEDETGFERVDLSGEKDDQWMLMKCAW